MLGAVAGVAVLRRYLDQLDQLTNSVVRAFSKQTPSICALGSRTRCFSRFSAVSRSASNDSAFLVFAYYCLARIIMHWQLRCSGVPDLIYMLHSRTQAASSHPHNVGTKSCHYTCTTLNLSSFVKLLNYLCALFLYCLLFLTLCLW